MVVITSCQSSGSQSQEPVYTNHLIDESSPYLLQHAHNPVDWHPWGKKALEKARAEKKMLLISIGYAACHWCHVMERESFEDTTVARIMNEHFINIKVDREERPDVDDVYMTACQMATGQACGWPLNAFALPDGRPVWAGTYSPKRQWIETLRYFIELQEKEPEKLDAYADRLLAGIAESDGMDIQPLEQAAFDRKQLREIVEYYYELVDFKRGGTKGAPKFPMPRIQEFLLAYHHDTGDPKALEAVTITLREMASGGIYDHLGGGFARYATDPSWHIPHFEKMLYDNAQLVSLYAHAYQLTGDPLYQAVIEETLAFISREMTGPQGGFYSSIDADSEGVEGKFYVWTREQVDAALDDRSSALVRHYYDIREKGNWEEGKNILDPDEPLSSAAEKLDLPVEEARALLEEAEQILFEQRSRRDRPGLDDKCLTAWNALMLKGYVDAYHALGNAAYLEAALRNGRFIREKMMQPDGRLMRNYKDGVSVINGFLDDYALTARAFLSLYQATFDETWLQLADKLTSYALAHFDDSENQLLHYTSRLDPPLVARKKKITDNVLPGPNSTMGRVLHDLGHYYYRQDYLERAQEMLRQVGGALRENADLAFYANWALLWLDQVRPPYEVAIVGPDYAAKRREMMKNYLPHALFLGGPDEGSLELLQNKLQNDRTMIYVCRNKVCKLPVTNAEKALELME